MVASKQTKLSSKREPKRLNETDAHSVYYKVTLHQEQQIIEKFSTVYLFITMVNKPT